MDVACADVEVMTGAVIRPSARKAAPKACLNLKGVIDWFFLYVSGIGPCFVEFCIDLFI